LLAEEIKKRTPQTLIVFGGPSCDNQELILKRQVDFLVFREGEETIIEFVEKIAKGLPLDNCAGIVFLKNNQVVKTKNRAFIENINTIPFPDFDSFNLSIYSSKALPMFTSRGCPNRCTFCSESPRWGRFRFRNAENIVNEMERNIQEYGITHFSMEDSTINGNIAEFEKCVT